MVTTLQQRPAPLFAGVDVETLADRMGVEIMEGNVPEGAWGVYLEHRRLALLRPGLGPHQFRSTLAHELGHAAYGHVGFRHSWERSANTFAAAILLTPEAVQNAALFNPTLDAMAADLGVMPWVVETFVDQANMTVPLCR